MVNLSLLTWLLSCSPAAEETPTIQGPPPARPQGYRTNGQIGALKIADLRQAGVSLPPRTTTPGTPPPGDVALTPVGALLPRITGGLFDGSRGAALASVYTALPPERAALGMAGIDFNELLAAGCEDPGVLLDGVEEGVGWEGSLTLPSLMLTTTPPERDRIRLSEDCTAALLASGGDIDVALGAGCTEDESVSLYPAGSACRSCLEADGDYARCQEVAACEEEVTRHLKWSGKTYAVLRATALLCAPDFIGDLVLLSLEALDESATIDPYRHGVTDLWCIETWSAASESVELGCAALSAPGGGWGDALVSRVDEIRQDDGQVGHRGRLSVLDALEVEGTTFEATLISSAGVTALSAPLGSCKDAWGIDPLALQADGTDPSNPAHTHAREYIAALILKTSTTIDGIFVQPFTHNRCPEDGWSGPDAEGVYTCSRPGDWSQEPVDDGFITWTGQGSSVYAFPLMTLASTGLPDPDVPLGLSPRVLGSTTLADAEWEDCTWPATFTPDRIRMWDDQPGRGRAPYAAFDGQTYRLGKDGEEGVVMGLLTAQQRDFCPN